MATLQFSSEASPAQNAIVVVFDMAGFSAFCNHADRHVHIPKFVSAVFDLLDRYLSNPILFNLDRPATSSPRIMYPDFIKYTGDGALMIWLNGDSAFSEEFRTLLVATFRKFQKEFEVAVAEWEQKWCTSNLPKSIRVGISTGFVFPLRRPQVNLFPGDVIDYAGYCINLAARLQGHFSKIGFVIHRNLKPQLPGLLPFHALGMKGTSQEPVYLFEEDFKAVEKDESHWRTKFRRGE